MTSIKKIDAINKCFDEINAAKKAVEDLVKQLVLDAVGDNVPLLFGTAEWYCPTYYDWQTQLEIPIVGVKVTDNKFMVALHYTGDEEPTWICQKTYGGGYDIEALFDEIKDALLEEEK